MEQWQQTPEEAARARSKRLVINSVVAGDLLIAVIAVVLFAAGTFDGLVLGVLLAYTLVSLFVLVPILRRRL